MSKNILSRLIGREKADNQVAQNLKMKPYVVNRFDKEGNAPLHKAIERGELKLARLLLDFGADPNIKNKMGYTPLHLAVIYQNVVAIELLIKNNANVNGRSNSGKTPLHMLSLQGESDISVKIAEILLKNYASTSVRDASGMTPLDYLNSVK